jgi:3-phenylpropionate/trans-cinnamate dioxygenase ferredoxin reductase subunit
MENFKYLIIGGGMTAVAAMKGIREIDPQGSIGVVGMEPDSPYKRPPLSKGLWKGKPLDSIWLKTDELQAKFFLGRRIVSLDPGNLTVQDDQGATYQGEKILLATGGTPRKLPFGGDQIIYYRSLADYKHLADLSQRNLTFAVIGGGFIGSEITAALAMNGRKVTMLFPEEGIGAAIYPHDLSLFLNDYYVKKGVSVWPGDIERSRSQPGKGVTENKKRKRIARGRGDRRDRHPTER